MRKSAGRKTFDFHQRLINYAIDGGALLRCGKHEGSVYRSESSDEGAREAVRLAWQSGLISSDLEGALSQLGDILERAPHKCSHPDCWGN